jgi:hypothetical protein
MSVAISVVIFFIVFVIYCRDAQEGGESSVKTHIDKYPVHEGCLTWFRVSNILQLKQPVVGIELDEEYS